MPNVPHITAGQWLGELGQGGAPGGGARARYPELSAQLDALRDVAQTPNAQREAELADALLERAATYPEGAPEEAKALADARRAITRGLRAAGGPNWVLLALVVAMIGVVGWWLWKRERRTSDGWKVTRNQPEDDEDDEEDN